MWASHFPPHVLGHGISPLKLHLWCVWRSRMFLIYCHTTKTSGVRPVDNGDMAWNHLIPVTGLGSNYLKTDRYCNPAATCGTAHCTNMTCHTTQSSLVVSIWCSVFGWRGSLPISVIMPVHWTVHKRHCLFSEAFELQTSLRVFTVCSNDGASSWHYGLQAWWADMKNGGMPTWTCEHSMNYRLGKCSTLLAWLMSLHGIQTDARLRHS